MIDTSSQFAPATLLAVDNTDTLMLVGASDVPTIKSLKIALETLELLEVDQLDVRILMNRSGAKVGLEDRDVERTLRREITYTLPSDKAVPVSVNRGQPVILDNPRSRVARSLPGDGAISGGRGREQAVKPDRRANARRPHAPDRAADPRWRQGAQKRRARSVCRDQGAGAGRGGARAGVALNEGEVAEDELQEQVQRAIDVALAEAGTPLSTRDRGRLVREITHNILGYGPIEPFLADDSVTEVMVNNHSTIYVERKGVIEETDGPLRVRAAPAPGDRPHRRPDRPAHRRVSADGGRPPARRLARQRHHPAAGDHRPVADDPQVLATSR